MLCLLPKKIVHTFNVPHPTEMLTKMFRNIQTPQHVARADVLLNDTRAIDGCLQKACPFRIVKP